MKAICFKDVKPGDVVAQKEGDRFVIMRTDVVEKSRVDFKIECVGDIRLFNSDDFYLVDDPDQIIGLVHRPWSEGKTEGDMLSAIWTAVQKKGVYAIREALDAYELGVPL